MPRRPLCPQLPMWCIANVVIGDRVGAVAYASRAICVMRIICICTKLVHCHTGKQVSCQLCIATTCTKSVLAKTRYKPRSHRGQ